MAKMTKVLGETDDGFEDTGTLRETRNAFAEAAETALAKGGAAALVVVRGEETGKALLLGQAVVTLGHRAEAQLQLTDPSVADAHAQVAFEGGVWVARALTPDAQLFVNDQHVEEFALRDGDRLRLGRSVVKLLSSGDLLHRYREEIFRAETHDAITTAATRAIFDEALEVEVQRARRYGQPLALVMVDVDGFKQLNQHHGEAAGTMVLQRLTTVFRTHLRRRDLLARVGDDEWAVLLPEADAESAQEVAERLRKAAEAERVATEHGSVRVTVSAGVAMLAADDEERALTARATAALVRAQRGMAA